jgi:AcrR family transcriptional regulator
MGIQRKFYGVRYMYDVSLSTRTYGVHLESETNPMTASTKTTETRIPLSRRRVLEAAIDLADREGIEALTMRRLGQELGVEAMSLYNHVANKEDLLDGVVETLIIEIDRRVIEIDPPANTDDWKRAMRERILTARSVLLRHPWAPGVIESRTEMHPPLIGYFDGLLGVFVAGGFTFDVAHHAMHALGSRALGFTQELFVPDDDGASAEMTTEMIIQMASVYPNIAGMLEVISHDPTEDSLGWCDDETEFTFGLDLILDGLDRLRTSV